MELMLTEWGSLGAVELSPDQRDALLSAGADISLLPEPGYANRWRVFAGSKVGVIVAAGLTVRIRPKVPTGRLCELLSFAFGDLHWRPAVVAFAQSESIEDVVARALVEAIDSRLPSGLLRGYRQQEEEACIVRGRIDIGATLRSRPITLLPLSLVVDDFTVDIPENRLLKAALRALLSRLVSRGARSMVLSSLANFEDVSFLADSDLATITRTRLNEHWWGCLELALLVLQSAGLDLGDCRIQARSFTVDMALVFERFVAAGLSSALRTHGLHLRTQDARLKLDLHGLHSLRPDLSVWSGSNCQYLCDCKYKLSDGPAERSDLYQALAYATAAGLAQVTLVYVGPGGAQDCRLVGGVTVRVRSLDLAGDWTQIRASFAKMALDAVTEKGSANGA